MKKEPKLWTNHKGETIPDKYVNDHDKLKEKTVIRIEKKATKLSNTLKKFKTEMFKDCDAVIDSIYKQSNTERKQGKGNYTIYSFDKSIKIEISVDDIIDFNDKIQIAQVKINDFLEKKLNGADEDLSVLVNNAFKTTKGRLDKARIFSLFQLNIKHPIWLEAMELIKDSITTNSTRRYVSVHKREADDSYRLINLNISSI